MPMDTLVPLAAARAMLLGAARRLRGDADQPDQALVDYARRARPLAVRALRAYERWLDYARDLSTTESLANAASVQRWEYANWAEALAGLAPPLRAERLHTRLVESMFAAARASQLLGRGYRATTYATVCDGHALLSDAVDSVRLALLELGRRAAQRELSQPAQEPEERRRQAS